jgi:hypothetical protein
MKPGVRHRCLEKSRDRGTLAGNRNRAGVSRRFVIRSPAQHHWVASWHQLTLPRFRVQRTKSNLKLARCHVSIARTKHPALVGCASDREQIFRHSLSMTIVTDGLRQTRWEAIRLKCCFIEKGTFIQQPLNNANWPLRSVLSRSSAATARIDH